MTITITGSKNIIAVATCGVFTSKLSGTGSNKLLASPASILAYYIINTLGTFTSPADGSTWPLFETHLPDGRNVEDNSAVIFDTTGVKDGRLMTGLVPMHFGILVRLRSLDHEIGYAKVEDLAADLDTVLRAEVSIGANDYIIQNVSRSSPIVPLGIEEGTKRRFVFTINFLVSLRKV